MGTLAQDMGKASILLRGLGRDFKLGVITLDDLADFELWAEHRADRRAEVFCEAMAGELSEGEIKRILDDAADEAGDLVVDALTPRGARLMQSVDGLRFIGWRSARVFEPDLKFLEFRAACGIHQARFIADNLFEITGLRAMQSEDPTTPATGAPPIGVVSSETSSNTAA